MDNSCSLYFQSGDTELDLTLPDGNAFSAPLSGFLSAAAGVGQSGQLKAKQRALPSATLGTGERHRRNDPRRPGVTRGRRSAALKAARPLHAHTHAGWCASGRGVHATATLQECNKVSKRASAGM